MEAKGENLKMERRRKGKGKERKDGKGRRQEGREED